MNSFAEETVTEIFHDCLRILCDGANNKSCHMARTGSGGKYLGLEKV